MSIVTTKSWNEIAEKLARTQSPYLPLVQFILDSDFASEIFGDVFLSGLLISDSPDFQWGKHMLRIENLGQVFKFSYERGPGGHKDNTTKEVPASKVIETLDLFLKVKFGVNLKLRKRAA
jgi:hypothetical protein